jgi:phospholipid-binding lipoprotein MlaA
MNPKPLFFSRYHWVVIGAAALIGLSACASTPRGFDVSPGPAPEETAETQDDWLENDPFDTGSQETAAEAPPADPLYPFNIAMFHVNDKLYFWVLKPVSTTYKAVLPTPARIGVKNFFQNLTTPVRVVNCLLQGKSERAGVELGRFMVNSTVGIGGLWDAAADLENLPAPPPEDFGQTLAVWGLDEGWYVVWPFFGPSSIRDTFGMAGDNGLDPASYISPLESTVALSALQTINSTSFRVGDKDTPGDYESLKNAALIPYEAFRDAYFQHRRKAVSE